MDKKQTTATCPKCGEEIVQCENCENMGCPDCDGFVVTRDDVILCPECAAACKEDCDKMRAVGCGSCALVTSTKICKKRVNNTRFLHIFVLVTNTE